jgi:hypothetical protein
MKRALIVPVERDRPVEVKEIETDFRAVGQIVGGYIEAVSAVDRTWHAYCDEEGKLKGLLINTRATLLARELGWPPGDVICGPAVFLGDGPGGDEADVQQIVINTAVRIGCEVRAT